ncbi:MAG: helix-turn-helix transcriptional regulator [Acidimicrobiales bacterium]
MAGEKRTVGSRAAPEPAPVDNGAEARHQLVQAQARALGEATRYRIFRYVTDAGGPVGVAEITAHVGVNHNSVRQHLAKLCAAGLLVEEQVRSGGRGRPALRYRPAPTTGALWGASSPYEHLAVLLLEVLGGADPHEVGRTAGRRALAGSDRNGDPLDVLQAEMTRQGFHCRREEAGERVELVVTRCPFEAAATVNPDVVCELHRGLTRGMVEGLGDAVVHIDLLPGPPRTAGCRILLERAEQNR